MIDLNKGAEEYAAIPCTLALTVSQKIQIAYMSGANSKYVQAKIIQAQIDVLKSIRTAGFEEAFVCLEVYNKVNELQQQLKQLEDEI
jgi:hypothetical protein